MQHWWKDIDREKQRIRKNPVPVPIPSTNLIYTDLESSPGHWGWRPSSNNCLSLGTATKTKMNVNFVSLRSSYLKENTLHRHFND